MRIELIKGINNISGKSGNVLFKTYKRADGTTETRAYLVPKAEDGKYKYERSTPVSKHEIQIRALFSKRQQRVNQLLKANPKLSKKEAWKIAKTEIKDLLSFD